jgi:hypothetical protein
VEGGARTKFGIAEIVGVILHLVRSITQSPLQMDGKRGDPFPPIIPRVFGSERREPWGEYGE